MPNIGKQCGQGTRQVEHYYPMKVPTSVHNYNPDQKIIEQSQTQQGSQGVTATAGGYGQK